MASPREIDTREKLTRRWLAAEPSVRAFVAAAVRAVSDREDVLQQIALRAARGPELDAAGGVRHRPR